MTRLRRTIAAICVITSLTTTTLAYVPQALAVERYEVMMEGDEDKWVKKLQEELVARGYMDVNPTGYYGSATVEAVKKLQAKKGLTVDGVAGIATQKALYGKYYAEISSSRAEYVTVTVTTSETAGGYKRYQVMMFGDSDEYVLKLQKELKSQGYLSATPTGYFGESTLAAVIAFQEKKNLTADGIAGVATQKALYGGSYSAIPSTREVINSASSEESDEDFESLREGSAGVLVETIQKRLVKYGYLTGDTTKNFGSATKAAVINFQKANGLKADGVVGKATYSLLFTIEAISASKAGVKAVSTSGGSSNGSSGSSSSSSSGNTEQVNSGKKGDVAIIEEAIEIAMGLIGTPYRYGGKGPNSFDCSGFTSYVLNKVGIDCSSSSKAQGNNTKWDKIDFNHLQRGDLIIFTNTKLTAIGHVGIYLGDGRFIHCTSGSAYSVAISYLEGSYVNRFLWARRWAPEAADSGDEPIAVD